ncbi:nascent polypeptide-associated complex subunit alpha, muscle-specific form [Pipra filicauda]|uniref:Nascent polypeptide-associated complex subunit alpha, muscle-specific form n=1 Tax=Pipra filicauda TaxID=649802 RepID=A0A6J2J168_9PASS|nr:nascent polypeptide-associated complex subunit alpha, muscle-specific form [Pipra filicauda]
MLQISSFSSLAVAGCFSQLPGPQHDGRCIFSPRLQMSARLNWADPAASAFCPRASGVPDSHHPGQRPVCLASGARHCVGAPAARGWQGSARSLPLPPRHLLPPRPRQPRRRTPRSPPRPARRPRPRGAGGRAVPAGPGAALSAQRGARGGGVFPELQLVSSLSCSAAPPAPSGAAPDSSSLSFPRRCSAPKDRSAARAGQRGAPRPPPRTGCGRVCALPPPGPGEPLIKRSGGDGVRAPVAQSVSARYLYSSTKPSNAEVVSSSLTWSTQLFGRESGLFWDLAALRREEDKGEGKNYAAVAAAKTRWRGALSTLGSGWGWSRRERRRGARNGSLGTGVFGFRNTASLRLVGLACSEQRVKNVFLCRRSDA